MEENGRSVVSGQTGEIEALFHYVHRCMEEERVDERRGMVSG
jgi:hypothetical protein